MGGTQQTRVRTALEGFSDDFLECRAARRHDFSWRRALHRRMRDQASGRDMREITRECPRCGTRRIDLYWESVRRHTGGEIVVLRMERIRYRYDYPEDYLAVGVGIAAFDADELLLEMLRRYPGELISE